MGVIGRIILLGCLDSPYFPVIALVETKTRHHRVATDSAARDKPPSNGLKRHLGRSFVVGTLRTDDHEADAGENAEADQLARRAVVLN
jgi:hypothetical protein